MPANLSLLATYTQLLQLCKIIFREVLAVLLEVSKHNLGSCSGPSHSRVSVEGMLALGGHLQAKILMQVIEHHLEELDSFIGFPAELSLSGRVCANGVFGNLNSTELVHTVIAQYEAEESHECPGVFHLLKNCSRI